MLDFSGRASISFAYKEHKGWLTVVTSSVASQLEDLGAQVLEDTGHKVKSAWHSCNETDGSRSQVDGSTSTNAVGKATCCDDELE